MVYLIAGILGAGVYKLVRVPELLPCFVFMFVAFRFAGSLNFCSPTYIGVWGPKIESWLEEEVRLIGKVISLSKFLFTKLLLIE